MANNLSKIRNFDIRKVKPSMNETRIITSALPYVNNLPHLGNIVGCVLSSDVYSRFCRKRGYTTYHICGTDEYGTATEIKALEMGMHPSEICSINSALHKKVYDWFNIEFDYFGRTSCSSHTALVHEIFHKIYDNGFFVSRKRNQFFCDGCALFLADRFVNGRCYKCKSEKARGDQCDDCGILINVDELLEPTCALCCKTPVMKETDHLFLKLNDLQQKVANHCEQKIQGWSKNAQKITQQWLNLGLTERCMTRDLKFKWGVSVPLKNYEEKVFYVWFDAPIGYYTFLKELLGPDFRSIMQSDKTKLYQFMGKDNVPFHSIVFPAILLATNDNYKIVDHISSTEYLLFENSKFSKSRNIGIFGNHLLDDRIGISCYWRFYLMKIRPEQKDSNFSFEHFKASINSDLINNFGNLVNRTLKYIKTKLGCVVKINDPQRYDDLVAKVNGLYLEYLKNMQDCHFRSGLQIFLDMCNLGNSFLQESFNHVDVDKNSVFCVVASLIYLIAHVAEPFIPESSKKIFIMIRKSSKTYPDSFVLLDEGHRIHEEIKPLYMCFTKEQLDSLK